MLIYLCIYYYYHYNSLTTAVLYSVILWTNVIRKGYGAERRKGPPRLRDNDDNQSNIDLLDYT